MFPNAADIIGSCSCSGEAVCTKCTHPTKAFSRNIANAMTSLIFALEPNGTKDGTTMARPMAELFIHFYSVVLKRIPSYS